MQLKKLEVRGIPGEIDVDDDVYVMLKGIPNVQGPFRAADVDWSDGGMVTYPVTHYKKADE